MTRSTLVFTCASLLSWGSGEVVDWAEAKFDGKPPVTIQEPDDLFRLLNVLNQDQTVAQAK